MKKSKPIPAPAPIQIPALHSWWIQSVINKRRMMFAKWFPFKMPQDGAAMLVYGIYMTLWKEY